MSKLVPKVVHHLAQYVFRHMSKENAWELNVDQDRVVAAIETTIQANLKEEETLNAEAKRLLEAQLAKMKGATIDEHKAFLLIKRQLAKQKGMVL